MKKMVYPKSYISSASKTSGKENEFGIQVGDIFKATWGYDQTNVNFFQVVALAGASSVRVVEVEPPIVKESYGDGGMSVDRIYKISRDILRPTERSVFIKNNTKGDLKRLTYGYSGEVSFKLDSYAIAKYCEPGNLKVYESWYH